MAKRPHKPGANEGYAVIWATALVLCFLSAFSLLVWDVATTGQRASTPALTFALSSVLLVGGLIAHCALGHVRGVASGLWPGLIFPAVFCAFHFASLGDLIAGWYNDRLFPFAWNLSVVCLLAWMVGHSTTRGSLRFHDQPTPRWGRRELGARELARIATLAALLLVVGFCLQLTVHFRLGLSSFGAMQYQSFKTALITNDGLAAVHLFGQMCCVVGVTVTVSASALGHRRLFFSRWITVVVGIYLVNLFFQGDRSEMSVVLFPMLIARHYFIRPFNLRWVVILAAFTTMLFAGTKVYRGTGELSDFMSYATDAGGFTNETGTTLDTVVRSVELVPEHYDYYYGATYGYALARVVPNIIMKREGPDFVSSAWVTQATSERGHKATGGRGFSIVAEAYINFGAIGAPLVLLLIGLFHGHAERWLAGRSVDIRLVVFFIVLEVALLIHVRNSVVLYVRGTIWMSILIVGLFTLHMLTHSKKRKGTSERVRG